MDNIVYGKRLCNDIAEIWLQAVKVNQMTDKLLFDGTTNYSQYAMIAALVLMILARFFIFNSTTTTVARDAHMMRYYRTVHSCAHCYYIQLWYDAPTWHIKSK